MSPLSEWTPSTPMVRSRYISTFAHMGKVFVYHDLFGYILEMSPDILEFLGAFRAPTKPMGVCTEWAGRFGDAEPESFVTTFAQFGCLVPAGEDEHEGLWDKVPVPARWTVWVRREDGGLTFYTAWGEREVRRHDLTPDEVQIWSRFDAQTRLEELAEEFGKGPVAALVERLVHHDLQAAKLSQVPMRMYRGRQHRKPPYLTSTMPYPAYDPDTDPAPAPLDDLVSPAAYYEREVDDAEAQFDQQETTLSHLFREPHPALGGRTYGQALIDALAKREELPAAGPIRVLEVGGGLGKVARAAIEALQARGFEPTWQIVELSPALAAAQRQETAGLPVQVHEADALAGEWPGAPYDLIVCNEMIGDLPAAQLTHEQARLGDDSLRGDDYQAWLAAECGLAGELIARYTIPIGDAPDPFYVNVGAMQLVERCAEALRPGGVAVITEFGEMSRWPILSSHLDHPELSIHFGHLMIVADRLGLKRDLQFVMDLIELDRDVMGLATTRSYFRALQSLLADHGVELRKIGYTREMFSELLEGTAVVGKAIGSLQFQPIEDRLMGLVPHEFKALLLQRPQPTAE